MEDTFTINIEDVRVGDWLFDRGYWRRVVDSHSRLNHHHDGMGKAPEWGIRLGYVENEWDWSDWDTYGWQDDDDYDAAPGAKVWPLNQSYEKLYLSRKAKVIVRNHDAQIIHPETLTPIRWWVAVYEVDQAYGGPEEGGWWYSTGEVRQSIPAKSYDHAVEIAESLVIENDSIYPTHSVLYAGGNYNVVVEEKMPEDYPSRRPYYC